MKMNYTRYSGVRNMYKSSSKLGFIIIWSFFIILAACHGALAAKLPARSTLSMLGWYSTPEELKAMQTVASGFEASNPGYRIKLTGVPWTGEAPYLEKILTMTAAGKAPDVFFTTSQGFPSIVESGTVLELTSYLSQDKTFKLDSYYPVAVEASKWKGRLWALPCTFDAFWCIVNETLLAEAGVNDSESLYRQGQWKFDNVMSIGRKIQKTDTRNPKQLSRIGVLSMGDVEPLSGWLWGFGGQVLSDDLSKSMLGDKKSIDGLKFFQENMCVKGSGAVAWGPPWYPSIDVAYSGKVGITPWWQSVMGIFTSKQPKWKLNAIPMPIGPASPITTLAAVNLLVVSAQSRDKKGAWRLAKYVAGPQGSAVFQNQVEWFQSHAGVQKTYQQHITNLGISGVKFLADAMSRTRIEQRTPNYARVFAAIDKHMTNAYAGKVSVEAAADAATKEVDVELRRQAGKRK